MNEVQLELLSNKKAVSMKEYIVLSCMMIHLRIGKKKGS